VTLGGRNPSGSKQDIALMSVLLVGKLMILEKTTYLPQGTEKLNRLKLHREHGLKWNL
jgi:hypothetical protein